VASERICVDFVPRGVLRRAKRGRRVTTGFGALLSVRTAAGSLTDAAPLLGAASLAFGLWYAAAAWSLAPYPF
jgi:hypothetical protein